MEKKAQCHICVFFFQLHHVCGEKVPERELSIDSLSPEP